MCFGKLDKDSLKRLKNGERAGVRWETLGVSHNLIWGDVATVINQGGAHAEKMKTISRCLI